MDATAVALGIAGLAATLVAGFGGIFLGDALQARRHRQLRLRTAADLVMQTSIEAVAYYTEVEAHLTGGAPEPTPARTDFAADVARSIAGLRGFGQDITTAYSVLSDRLRDAALTQGTNPDPAARAAARDAVMPAIRDFEAAVDTELDRPLLATLRGPR